jgi:hypothetical protein
MVKDHVNRIFAKLPSADRAQSASNWLATAPVSRQGLGERR